MPHAFKSRTLKSTFDCITSVVVSYFTENILLPANGTVLPNNGNQTVITLQVDDPSSQTRYVDQVQSIDEDRSELGPPVVALDNHCDLSVYEPDNIQEERTVQGSERIPALPGINHEHSHFSLMWDGYDVSNCLVYECAKMFYCLVLILQSNNNMPIRQISKSHRSLGTLRKIATIHSLPTIALLISLEEYA